MKPSKGNTNTEIVQVTVSGKQVCFRYQGRSHSFKLSSGMKHLLILLSNPNFPIAYALLDAIPPAAEVQYRQFNSAEALIGADLHVQEHFPPIPMADLQALKEIKLRLLQLISEQAELEEHCDLARLDELRNEQEALTAYLKEVYRPNGMAHSFSDAGSLQRKRVQKGLRRTLQQIAVLEPELAKQLQAGLSLQPYPVFHPEQLYIEVQGF